MRTWQNKEIEVEEFKEWPKVAIIVLNWNGWKDTIECLESVFRNSYPNYQVVVVDNGPTNDSVERIKAWAKGKQEVLTPESTHPLYYLSHPPVQKSIPYIEYDRKTAEAGGLPKKEKSLYEKLPDSIPHPMVLIQTGDNLGFAGGNNVGMRYTLAKNDFGYIWLLNNDMVIDKAALSFLLKKCRNYNRVGVVGSKVLQYYKPTIIQTAGGGKLLPCIGIEKGIGENEEDKGLWNREIAIDYVSGASFFIRSNVIDCVGLMDDSYFLFWEETDWCERIKRRGWKLAYSWESKVWHKGSSSVKAKSFIQDYYGSRNGVVFLRRYYKKCWIVGVFISFAGKIFNRIRRGNWVGLRAVVKAYVDAFLFYDKKGD